MWYTRTLYILGLVTRASPCLRHELYVLQLRISSNIDTTVSNLNYRLILASEGKQRISVFKKHLLKEREGKQNVNHITSA